MLLLSESEEEEKEEEGEEEADRGGSEGCYIDMACLARKEACVANKEACFARKEACLARKEARSARKEACLAYAVCVCGRPILFHGPFPSSTVQRSQMRGHRPGTVASQSGTSTCLWFLFYRAGRSEETPPTVVV